MVGSRDRSKLVDGVIKQLELVRAALGDDDAVPAHAALSFVAADWPLLGGAFRTRGAYLLWPEKLAALLAQPGPLPDGSIEGIHRRLAVAFPAA